MREREVGKMYVRELTGSLAMYAAILFAALRFGPQVEPGIWRTLALTSPMLGFCMLLWAIVRQFRHIDEFIR